MAGLSEKMMEDLVADNPSRFVGEAGLQLLSRQYRICSYVFDLLFQDRHGGKLIVELQVGTLDRDHTYRILDYYDQFQQRFPTEFVDVMVIANRIPPERQRRLRDRGIKFREIPEGEFLAAAAVTLDRNDVLCRKQLDVATTATSAARYYFFNVATNSMSIPEASRRDWLIDHHVAVTGHRDLFERLVPGDTLLMYVKGAFPFCGDVSPWVAES